MNGTLSEGVLPGLLRELYVGRKTGLLHFSRGEERCGVRFRHGTIVSGFTSVPDMRLGEILVRNGKLSPVELDRAAEIVIMEKKRLGQVLDEMDLLSEGELEDGVALHLREILRRVFTWPDGHYGFEEQADTDSLEGDITLKVSTGEVILEAARQVQDAGIVEKALGDLDRVLAPSTDPLLRFQKVTLTPSDGYVLSRIDGILSAREVLGLIPMVPEEVQRTLFALVSTGLVEFLPEVRRARPESAERPRPAPVPPPSAPPATAPGRPPVAAAAPQPAAPPSAAPDTKKQDVEARRKEILEAFGGLKAKNHFEVLGIPRASSEAQVKEAYFRLARRFHPDAHHDESLRDLRDKLEPVFIRLGQAYEILRNPRTRGNYEADLNARAPRMPPPQAENDQPEPVRAVDRVEEERRARESLRKAEKLMAEEQFWDVIQLLESALPALAGRESHRARVLMARAYLKNPKWVKQAEATLRSVLDEDARNADALYTLGLIYRDQGMKARAMSTFRKVVEIKPEHEQAQAELATLGPEEPELPPETKGGFLRKLFGRE